MQGNERKGGKNMKIKFICDKKYGGKYDKNGKVTTMDCTFFNGHTLDNIIKNYSIDGNLEITKEIVDYYNNDNKSACRFSFKTADSIAKQIIKLNNQQSAN